MTIVVYVDKQMTNTKIIFALVAVAALTLAAFGVAAAQIGQNQTVLGEPPNTAVPTQGFWGCSAIALAMEPVSHMMPNTLPHQ